MSRRELLAATAALVGPGCATVTPDADPAAQGSSSGYGLDFAGDGQRRRMLYWRNPFPIYDASYIFKVYLRKKTSGAHRYYTTFFWGNDGDFAWDRGNANMYYGAHPYPTPAPAGPGQWEISVNSNDSVTGTEVIWVRWYTQAFRAWRESVSVTHHEFYWDLPDTGKVITRPVAGSLRVGTIRVRDDESHTFRPKSPCPARTNCVRDEQRPVPSGRRTERFAPRNRVKPT